MFVLGGVGGGDVVVGGVGVSVVVGFGLRLGDACFACLAEVCSGSDACLGSGGVRRAAFSGTTVHSLKNN